MKIGFIVLLLLSVVATAQPAGTFTATGNMTIARYGATATLLATGKVLIAGGMSASSSSPPGSAILASAELYDPATGIFTRTGDMIMPRLFHTATLLPDGKVLIAGGVVPSLPRGVPQSGELYDPSTGTFAATPGAMFKQYASCCAAVAVLLTDGRVLITSDPSIEIYDPVTGASSATADPVFLPSAATLLGDGSVLVANNSSAEVYIPATGTFRATGTADPNPAQLNFDAFGAAALTNGRVLLAGGYCEECDTFATGAELYDALTGTFARTGDMTTGRAWQTATSLGDGTVLMAGGDARSASAEVYNPSTGTFSRTGNMTTMRVQGHTATLLPDGTVLIAGGLPKFYYNDLPPQASAELYKPGVPVPTPVLFSLAGGGQSQGAIWHAVTGQIASANNPAIAGEALSMYTTGLVQGGVMPPQVAVGGRLAEILYFGDAPGYPGYFQVNFRVPSGVAPRSSVPVHLSYLGRPSNEVTIAAQ